LQLWVTAVSLPSGVPLEFVVFGLMTWSDIIATGFENEEVAGSKPV
jgi:hypothetical protein